VEGTSSERQGVKSSETCVPKINSTGGQLGGKKTKLSGKKLSKEVSNAVRVGDKNSRPRRRPI